MFVKEAFIKNYNSDGKKEVKEFLRITTAFLRNVYSSTTDAESFKKFLKDSISAIGDLQHKTVIENLISARNDAISRYRNLSDDNNSITITTTSDNNKQSSSSSVAKKKANLVVHFGDYLSLAHAIGINENTHVIVQNAANAFHFGGCVTYGKGSAEELLARKSNLWMEFVLTEVTGNRQKQALLLIFETVLKIMEVGEQTFFKSQDYQTYLEQVIAITVKENQDYWIDNKATEEKKRCHVNEVFYINHLDDTFENILSNPDSHFIESLILTQVASVAAIDQRIAGTEKITDVLAYRAGKANDKYLSITEQLIEDTFNVALKQATVFPKKQISVILLPIGCGAFQGDPKKFAQALKNVLVNKCDELNKANINIFIASFKDNYDHICNTLSTLQNAYNILPNAANFISNVGTSVLPTALASVKNTSLNLCSFDLTTYNGLELDAVMLSTNSHLAPQTAFFHGKKSLIGKLCDLSEDFNAACLNHPPISPGQIADMGQHIFTHALSKDKHLNPLQIILTTTHNITIAPALNDIKDMMTSYINGLLYLNNQAQHRQKKMNVALTLFGTGHYGWNENQILILAAKTAQYLITNNMLPNIQSIYFVSNHIKSLELATIFNQCFTDDKFFTDLLPRENFDQLLADITKLSSLKLSIKTMLEPSHNQHTKQNVCIYLTMYNKADNKSYVLFGNKDVNVKFLRQVKNAVTKQYDYLKVPGGRVDDNNLSIVETALKELQEETSIEIKRLTEAYPEAKICYAGSYTLSQHTAYLHCYWLDIGDIEDINQFSKALNFKGSDDINHLGLLPCDNVLIPNYDFSLPGMHAAKKIDKLNRKMLKTLFTMSNSFVFYPLNKIESLGLKMEFAAGHQPTLNK